MIKDILEKYDRRVIDGVVGFGYVNGWGEKSNACFKELKAFEVPGTQGGTNNNRGDNTYWFDISDGVDTFTLRYSVDSGD